MWLFLWEVEARGREPETVAFYKSELGQFCQYVDVDQWLKMETRDQRAELLRWLALWRTKTTRKGTPPAPATVAAGWRAVRAWVRWLHVQDYIPADPTATIPAQPSGWEPGETYSRDDIWRLLGLCPTNTWWGSRDRVIVCLAVFCGLRRKEIANLDLANLLIDQGLIMVKRTKNKKPRGIHVPPQLRSALTHYLMLWHNDAFPALVQGRNGARVKPEQVGEVWSRLCQRAGISGRKGAHRGRHTFVTESLRAGADINDVRLAAGHSSLDMTRKYAGTIESAEAARRLSQRGAMKDWA